VNGWHFNRERRRNMRRSDLDTLIRLRKNCAPRWIVRTAQIALLLHSEGLRRSGVGKGMSKRQAFLYGRFVQPLLNREAAE
jgi:hypothetical protein